MAKLITTRTRIADLGKPRVIVIGGGFAGLQVAKGLNGAKAQVVLFDRFNHHTFQPLLYQVATSGLEASSIVFPFRKRFANQSDFFFRMGEVISIKPEENYIETSIGGVKYDYLVIANGAGTNYYGMKDVEQNAIPMKTIIDSIQLRNRIIRNMENALLTDDPVLMNSLMDFVIVGGGPTGVELAGSLAELRKHVFPQDYKELEMTHMDIHLVEGTSQLLNGMSAEASEKALEYLQNMGVKVHLNCVVKSYDGYEVLFNTGEKLITRTLIWAAGVKGQPIEGLQPEVITHNGRIRVDNYNRVIGHENIFAIGDAALMEGDASYPNGHPMMAPPAIQQGRLLARNLKQLMLKKPMKPFRYFDKGTMATIGRNRAVVDIGKIKTQGFLAWYIWMFVHLLYIIGFKNKFFVMLSWLWGYFSYDKSNRLIISRNKDGVN
ncbi:NAD(P)/FAD-dependent oxidoreductase [Oscillatoria amoena NRMC-F 0135]|nr:NAD(P)/FAD-dependent oxidoreductase [Oscillatoria amoena NRMC-F 0135]